MKVERINLDGRLGIANAAKVSYGKSKEILDDKDIKLIDFLQKHNHISPFFHPQVSFILDTFDPARFSKEELQGIEWYKISIDSENPNYKIGIRCSMYSFINIFLKRKMIHKNLGYKKYKFDNKWLESQHDKYNASRLVYLQFRIKAPIFVVRQLEKSGFGFARNEKSGRYIKFENEFYEPEQWRKQSPSNKQGSLQNEFVQEKGTHYLYEQQRELCFDDINNITQAWYDNNITNGMAGEQARMILPLCTMTEFVWTASLQDYARLCSLRLKDDTQKETRDVANEIYNICKKEYPCFDDITNKRIELSKEFTDLQINWVEVEEYL